MKVTRKFNAAMALGSLTAAVALLAAAPDATAQTPPGGGSFPGSFLVPGTNTSIKIGGAVKIVYIYDIDTVNGDNIAVNAIPVNGTAAHQLHGATRLHARYTNVNFDTRTPTAYGDLTTFILLDGYGQNTAESQNASTTQNFRLVYGYGTLGPFLAGQWLSLWADPDALPEVVDATGFLGAVDGLSNRHPQFRYTLAAPGGFSAALSVENPEAEGFTNTAAAQAFSTTSAGSIGGIDRVPDILARLRIDQGWGHAALTALYRDQKLIAADVPRITKQSWGLEASGHLNTFGKDTLKGIIMAGQGLGQYMSDMKNVASIQTSTIVGASATAHLPFAYGGNVSYTHFWTASLRSSANVGYSRVRNEDSIITNATARNALDKWHMGGRANLIWSPVPQVDLGLEYNFDRRTVETGNHGNLHRLVAESVFKF